MIKHLKRLLSSVLLAGTILFGAISAPNIHNQYLRYEVGESVVQVLSPNGTSGGTGFAVQGASGEHYIMTNKHVCEVSVNNIVVIKRDGDKPYTSKVVYRDNRHDLCLIEGNSEYSPLTIATFAPDKGDLHYVVGHPGLRQLTTSVGEYIGYFDVRLIDRVSKKSQCIGEIYELDPIQQFFMQAEWICVRSYKSYSSTAVIYGGNSGSPVVNAYGNVIAVAFAGNTQQERNNFLVPLYEIKRVLAKF